MSDPGWSGSAWSASRKTSIAACESERWRLDAVLERVDAKLAELEALRGRIVDARDACADGRCSFTTLTHAD